MLGGAQYGQVYEKYSDNGGLIYFKDDAFTYRVDFQRFAGEPRPLPTAIERLDEVQRSYFHKQALPLTYQDRPGGTLIAEGARDTKKRRVYWGVLHYDKPGPDPTLAATGPHYKAVVVYLTSPYAYTITSEVVDRADAGQSKQANIDDAIGKSIRHLDECSFGAGQL